MNKKDILPLTFSTIGFIGTFVSSYLGIRAGMKIADIYSENEDVDKKEIIKTCIPVGVSCVLTTGCNITSNIILHKQRNDIVSLAAVIGSSYVGYRQEVIKRYGEDVDREIAKTVNKNHYVCNMHPEIPDKLCHWIVDMCDDNLPTYELDAYERDIINAERHLNRNYMLNTYQSFGDFLAFLGFKNVDKITDAYGWAIEDNEIYVIDFEHVQVDDNTFRIVPIFSPWYDYENQDMFGESY